MFYFVSRKHFIYLPLKIPLHIKYVEMNINPVAGSIAMESKNNVKYKNMCHDLKLVCRNFSRVTISAGACSRQTNHVYVDFKCSIIHKTYTHAHGIKKKAKNLTFEENIIITFNNSLSQIEKDSFAYAACHGRKRMAGS